MPEEAIEAKIPKSFQGGDRGAEQMQAAAKIGASIKDDPIERKVHALMLLQEHPDRVVRQKAKKEIARIRAKKAMG